MQLSPFTQFLGLALLAWAAAAHGQLSASLIGPEHPAIAYGATASTDAVVQLVQRLQAQGTTLGGVPGTARLRALLAALDIPVESQIALFSKTSLQSNLITPRNPRTIFFNDTVTVAWMRGGFIEIAAQDPRQGAVFYTLPQVPGSPPVPSRDDSCVRCHYSAMTLGVPGFMARSIPSGTDGSIMPWLGGTPAAT